MTSAVPRQWGIGGVSRRTVVTERTLRCYEEPGVRAPARDAGGRRRYDGGTIDRLTGFGCSANWALPRPTSTPTQMTWGS